MKKQFRLLFTTIVILGLLFSSCEKLFEEEPGGGDDQFLASYELTSTISQIEVNAIFAYLAVQYPDAETIKEKATEAVKVYKITYNTTFQDEPITASGLVCIPIGTETYPVLSFQNGTNTLHDNAPSVNPDRDLFQFIEAVAATGFIVVLPDYIGFGASDDVFHPYLDKESTVQCCIDLLKATKELMANHNLKVNVSDDLYITGYSMGGWATCQLQKEIETNYATEFNLKASACCAGPYNLIYINNYIMENETYPRPYFPMFMLNSYINLGDITNNYSDIVNEPYASLIPNLFDGTKDGDEIDAQLTTLTSELYTEAFRNGYQAYEEFTSVRQTLLKNSVEPWVVTTPMAIIHGAEDTFVPPQVSQNLYDDIIALGVSENLVQHLAIPGVDHTEGIVPAGVASIKWFLEIRNGE